MIDYFALALTHALLALAVWRMVQRADLDQEGGEADADQGDQTAPPPQQQPRLKVRPRA